MSGMGTDLRIAIRGLAANPGFAALAVLTMALGIGINTAMFTFADGVLLKPLDYRDADRLVFVWEVRRNCNQCLPSPPAFVDWKTMNTVFSGISAYTLQTSSLNLTGAGAAEQVEARHVSTDYFDVLGVRPALGRAFQDGEDQVGAPGVAILSNRIWRRKFGADVNVAGKSVSLDGEPYTVAGVLPAGVFDRLENDIWLPLVIPPERMRRSTQFFAARARLKPGVTVAQADGEMKRLARALNEQNGLPAANSVVVVPLRESIVGPRVRTLLTMLMGAVAFVLLIATVNVANLMLARSASRRRETVIRAVLGAGRLRLARQFLAEGLLLAAAGGLAGVLLAVWLVDALRVLVPPATLPQETVITMDMRVLLFAALMSLGTGIVVGLLPAWRGVGRDLAGHLKEHGTAVSGRFVRDPVRATLLVSEVALTVVLLVGATLMLRSFFNLLGVDPGFRAAQVLTFRTTLSDVRFPTAEHVQAYQSDLLARLRAIPGVTAASFSNALPMTGSGSGTDFLVMNDEGGRRERGNARIRTVDPAYFSTLGLRLVQGRLLTEQDTQTSMAAVVVNQTLARQYLPGNPLGRQVLFAGKDLYTVVGVVADTKHNGPAQEAPNEIYVRWQQLPPQWFRSFGRTWHFVVRAAGDPAALAGAVQSLASAVDAGQPVFSVRTLDDVVQEAVAEPRLVTALFLLFGFLALGLAAVGLFGVLAYLGTQRAREMAIRMALGAQVGHVWRLVIGQGLKLTLAGVLVGLGAATALAKLLSSLLFEIQPYDPLTFFVVPVLLGLVAVTAGLAPALRAGRVDPVVALRQE